MNIDQARAFLAREFPQNTCEVTKFGPGTSTVRQSIDHRHLRPGGTVSGPTSLNINFLRKPVADQDILAECHLLKAGKRLVVCEVSIYSEGLDQPVAHVTATYSIPTGSS